MKPASVLALLVAVTPALALAAPNAGQSITVLSVVGTSDLHGHVEALPLLGGYLANLRQLRSSDGGVVLVDAGDLFQGTLESNSQEGAPVISVYNQLGYTAAVFGNHEFDFGPKGPAPAPTGPDDDPRGAIKARAREARFPFLAANIIDEKTGKPIAWQNVYPSVIVELAGVHVGIVGVTTPSAKRTSFPANMTGLSFAALVPTLTQTAKALRTAGAQVVIGVAHEGGGCQRFDAAADLSSCDTNSEIFNVARVLPPGTLDVLVGGHTHNAVAHQVAGLPVIQSFSNGRAFGRVDVVLDKATGRVLRTRILQPQSLCGWQPTGPAPVVGERCHLGTYEDGPVRADESVQALLEPVYARVRELREQSLGVTLLSPLRRSRERESPLGNLVADLMRQSHATADLAITTAGGIRADLPAGPLKYGDLFEAMPFDNSFASIRTTARQLRTALAHYVMHSSVPLALSGIRVAVQCKRRGADVLLTRENGARIAPNTQLTVITSDFVATGGDGLFDKPDASLDSAHLIRDTLAEMLRKRGGTIDPADSAIADPDHPRVSYPNRVTLPLQCGINSVPERKKR